MRERALERERASMREREREREVPVRVQDGVMRLEVSVRDC